jgi:hypothetical protein
MVDSTHSTNLFSAIKIFATTMTLGGHQGIQTIRYNMFGSFLRCSPHHRLAALSTLSVAAIVPNSTQAEASSNNDKDAEMFENQCLKRQLHQPKVPYPAWDYNWDDKAIPGKTDFEGHKTGEARKVKGKTRHIILVRHGQYDETFEEDEKRRLTPLGRLQAAKTGKRLGKSVNFSQLGIYILPVDKIDSPLFFLH